MNNPEGENTEVSQVSQAEATPVAVRLIAPWGVDFFRYGDTVIGREPRLLYDTAGLAQAAQAAGVTIEIETVEV